MSYYKPKLVEPKLIKYYVNRLKEIKEQCGGDGDDNKIIIKKNIIEDNIIIKEDSLKKKILNYIYNLIIDYYSLII